MKHRLYWVAAGHIDIEAPTVHDALNVVVDDGYTLARIANEGQVGKVEWDYDEDEDPMPTGSGFVHIDDDEAGLTEEERDKVPGDYDPRHRLLAAMTTEGLEDLSQTIRISLDLANKTADALRAWLRLVEDAIERGL